MDALCGLAAWCSQFTPRVTLEPPATVLLEVAASLTLFKGLPALLRAQRAGLKTLGHEAAIAAAPTALAAAWLARAGIEKAVTAAGLEQKLLSLPVTVLAEDAKLRAALAGIGVASLGQLLALPRAGLARRFGPGLIDRLDRALGRRPDPRPWYQLPPIFCAGIDLPAAVADAEQLLFAARRLVLQLCGYLAGRLAGVQHFRLELLHGKDGHSVCGIGLVAPAADSGHFLRLLREHLQRLLLPAPVTALILRADDIRPLRPDNLSLFQDGAQAPGDAHQLVEQLRARLGTAAVGGLTQRAAHRPECASVAAEVGAKGEAAAFGPRPLWLLAPPQVLAEEQAQPHYRGPLQLLAGPERIESGWWDDGDVKRDYFLARNPEQALLWVYRERQLDGRWYLHGFFA